MITTTSERGKSLRAGIKIRGHLLGTERATYFRDLPIAIWQQCCQTADRLRFVQSRDWRTATQSVADDLHFTTGCLLRELNLFREQLPQRQTPRSVASANEIAADLVALEQEFEEVALDLRERTVSVVTTPIALFDGTSHDKDFLGHDSPDGTHDWRHHQSQDTQPPQWIERVEHVFHFDLH